VAVPTDYSIEGSSASEISNFCGGKGHGFKKSDTLGVLLEVLYI
jgi:hypothetical protein